MSESDVHAIIPRSVYGRADVPLPVAAEAVAADRAASGPSGIPARVLMENAGRAAALVLDRLHPRGTVVGLAGSGNNGGDLLVMLRTLRAWGREVTVLAAGSRPPDPSLAGDLTVLDAGAAGTDVLRRADVLVDGLLGTGSSGAPRGPIAGWIEQINGAGRPVLALDLPSGVDPTTGRVHEPAVRAISTVSFGWPKLGLLLQPARQQCGRLIAVDIGFPADALAAQARAITPAWVRERMRPRAPAAHKGTAGRVLLLGGSHGMAGAAALAAEAAVRSGAGLVRLASTPQNREILQVLVPEATFVDRGELDAAVVATVDVLVAGPGLGTDEGARTALVRALELVDGRPALLDADALNILARTPSELAALAAERPVVLTPHPGELARLSGTAVAEITGDAPAAARSAARAFGCVVLLKGQPSLVATPDGQLLVNTVGSSDLAAAGTGDQLAGTIGALLGRGHSPSEAAALGLFLAGRAADISARGVSLTPRDISAALAAAMADPGHAASPTGLPFVTFDQPPRR